MTSSIVADTVTEESREQPTVSFEQSLPRRWVHRAANTEVLVTSFGERGENDFVLGAQLPRAHALYGPVAGGHDPLLFAEAARQAGLVVGHVGFGVPYGHQFIMDTLDYEVKPEALRLADTPAQIVLEIHCENVKWRGRTFAGANMHVHGYRDGVFVGRVTLPYSCISPAAYARIRAGCDDFTDAADQAELPESVPPWRVGRDCPSDVLLAPTPHERTWLLRDGRTHPVLFDHPVDHVPGMTALEAARQAARSEFCPDTVLPVGMRTRFHSYIELGRSCFVRVHDEPIAGDTVRVTLEQEGRVAVDSTVLVRRLSDETRR
ncbi:A-factor biosynthesis hotdog domain-containing protein [Actinopolyspora lacussalsi subsp. righensis]|uniref:A-factor biosynthesis hotdog domain-containing protein n=1 Tax=Actinopolyspora righensis TaxID=995060 RepID=A0A1I6X5P7_9ACTN|nr:ScbA/BarX family gamma-butyrolactone biosynthesis protein [Actinopolyspora righensis]SFT33221.1 A-factor biosynthesis hotdog domain-containing protein [Actinopolyspora righensis]